MTKAELLVNRKPWQKGKPKKEKKGGRED